MANPVVLPRPRPRARYLPATIAVTRRTVLKTVRTPPVLILALVQSIVFLLIFRYVFGGAIESGDLSYVDYMVPGLLTVGVLFSVMGVGVAVAEDLTQGIFDRFRSLPMPRSAVLSGRALAQTATTALTVTATMLVALAIGFRPRAGVLGLAAILALCLVVGVTFTWVFIAVGLATANVQAAQGLAFLVMPLSFVSSAYVPTATMPGWLRAFAEHQPLTVAVNAARYLAHGPIGTAQLPHSGPYYVTATLAWCLGILAGTVSTSVVLYRRR
jgi:ABC transporter DrrB family efflux protein